jgi:hypothetical protein
MGLINVINILWLMSASSFWMILVWYSHGILPSLLATMFIAMHHLSGDVPYLNSMIIIVECALLSDLLVVTELQRPMWQPETEYYFLSWTFVKAAINFLGVMDHFFESSDEFHRLWYVISQFKITPHYFVCGW